MATFDPTKPPLSLEDKLAASPPATSVTGTTKLLTPDLKTVELKDLEKSPEELAAKGFTVQVIGVLTSEGEYDEATQAAIEEKRSAGWPNDAIYVKTRARTNAERAADGQFRAVYGYVNADGQYDAALVAEIEKKRAKGWPDYAIWVRVLGTSATSTTSAAAMVPAFAAMTAFMSPTVAGQQVATGTVAQFSAMAAFISPTVSAQRLASASAPQFSAVSTFTAPTVYATHNATATVPQLSASATFSAPSVTVTPAGATVASVIVPSFGAVATLTAPSVTAQGAATATVPSFSALVTFAAATVLAQRAATAAVPSFSATSTLTNPPVAATRVATASVPSFGATAAFAAPTVAGVQQAAAVSASATVPSFTARATLTAPSAIGIQMSAAPTQPVISATGGDTTVTIAKTSGGTGATSYDLKWGTAAGNRPNTISGVTLPYTHTGRTNGTTYYYSLVATNAQGSTESAEVSASAAAAGAPVTLSFESATVTDSSGATWEKVIPSAVDQGAVGVITSGVAGISGADGNCLSIKQSVYDDGSDLYNLDTFIRRTMNVGAGTLSLRVKRTNASMMGYVKVDGVNYSLGLTTIGSFVDKAITIPASKNNVVVEIGFTGGTAYVDNYIDTVSIPQ